MGNRIQHVVGAFFHHLDHRIAVQNEFRTDHDQLGAQMRDAGQQAIVIHDVIVGAKQRHCVKGLTVRYLLSKSR
jgi:nicotinamidase-related amidase